MFKYILRNFFSKQKKVVKKPMTIINENRNSTLPRRVLVYYKENRQTTCLSKYFSNIKGLNTIERNLYSKIV